jgi:thioredoxin reductase
MAVETPARIAILGAGPIGLEAALYARYLGYDVDLYERGRAAEHLRQWGHVRLFTPFSANSSPLGMAALATQDTNWKSPAADALVTGRELVERYLAPLSQSDLLTDCLHERTEIVSVGRGTLLKGDLSGEERAEADFRLLLRSYGEGGELLGDRFAAADVVIDATGVFGRHNWLGQGGLPAVGEPAAAPHIEYGLPDILGRDREHYAHHHTLVVGAGHSAAATVMALARLGHEAPYTRVTWVVPRDAEADGGPILRIAADPWPERDRLACSVNQLIGGEIGHLSFRPGTAVEQITWHGSGHPFQVRLSGRHAVEMEVDRIVANVGFRPNSQIYAELQVAEDPATAAPTGWLAEQEPRALVTAEPDFYVLGAKSLGRMSLFTIADGLKQVRQLFTIIGDRPDLNLYEGQRLAANAQG